MFDKNIIRFLQFRESIIDTKPLEEKYGISLPPIYRSFISVFKPYFAHQKVMKSTGGFQSFVVPFYSSVQMESYSSDDDEFAFESFKEVEEVLTFSRSNQGHLKDLLFIANHGYSGGLLVGIGEENQDKIYHNTDSPVVNFIAENIYEVISKIGLIQYDFETPPIETNKLYKNWGEDFWRNKEDGEIA